MNASLLKKRMVVSMDGGASIGTVEDVLFDTEQLRVTALVLELHGAQSILPFEAVQSIGADAITVALVEPAAAAPTQAGLNLMRSIDDLLGLRVVDGEAKSLGEVRTLTIDELTGSLTELEAHSGGMLGLGGHTTVVPAAAIRGIGDDFVTAEMSAASAG